MKKVYEKPEIMFESFILSTNIAAGCEIVIDNHSSGSCGYEYEGGSGTTMFTVALGEKICNIPIDDDEKNTFCYHVPIQTNNLFNS